MINSMRDAVVAVAEKTYDNTRELKKQNRQRRDEFTDLYGIEFHRNGSADSPAVFHVSVSGDAQYMQRFQFKLVIESFQIQAKADTSKVSLELDLDVTNETLIIDPDSITPNPHSHKVEPGIANIPVTASDFTVEVEGIDITPYLRAQVEENGWNWFNGEGVYPSSQLEESFDLIQVACDLDGEGREEDARKILRQGWKPITLRGSQPFSAILVLYLKYPNMGR